MLPSPARLARPLASLCVRDPLDALVGPLAMASSSSDIDSVDPKIVTRYEVGQRLGKGACMRAHSPVGTLPRAPPKYRAETDALLAVRRWCRVEGHRPPQQGGRGGQEDI